MADTFDPSAFLVLHGLADRGGQRVTPLPGGYQNQVFRVRGDRFDWVVKRFRPAAEVTLFPNLPDAEALALQRLSACGAAPKPVAYIPDSEAGPILVYVFYPGQAWDGDVAAVARLLRRLADADADGFRHVPMLPADILAQGEVFAAASSAPLRERLQRACPQPVDLAPGRRRLVHTDFGPGNLISGADGLKAIDWQCPAAGDAAEDVAAFLSPAFQILYGRQPLTEKEERALLASYDDDETVRRFHRLRLFFDWRMAAYCAMRQGNLAETRPEASERYRQATDALLERMEARR